MTVPTMVAKRGWALAPFLLAATTTQCASARTTRRLKQHSVSESSDCRRLSVVHPMFGR
jgi:hypothetical protein